MWITSQLLSTAAHTHHRQSWNLFEKLSQRDGKMTLSFFLFAAQCIRSFPTRGEGIYKAVVVEELHTKYVPQFQHLISSGNTSDGQLL